MTLAQSLAQAQLLLDMQAQSTHSTHGITHTQTHSLHTHTERHPPFAHPVDALLSTANKSNVARQARAH